MMRFRRRLLTAAALAALLVPRVIGQSYTLAPAEKRYWTDSNGVPLAGGHICTYATGTNTPQLAYRDTVGTVWTDPIVLDASGGAVIYLPTGSQYKFAVYSCANGMCPSNPPNCSTDGTLLYTVDPVAAVPTASANVDVSGLAGATVTGAQCVYLSDGSGALTPGRWYPCDSTNAYSSTTIEIGIATAAATVGGPITVRISGEATGLSSLSPGAEYFVGTSGALTATAPSNRRHVGHADSATTLVLTGNPNASPLTSGAGLALLNGALQLTAPGIPCGRVGLASGVYITTTDQTAATTVYYNPLGCNTIGLYDGTKWNLRALPSPLSIAVPSTTASCYDVFAFDNSGVAALELSAAWSTCDGASAARFGSGTYASLLPTQDNVPVKSTNGTAIDATRRYLGSFRTTGVSGQTEDSVLKRYVWNYYNRVDRELKRFETTASWTYNSSTVHQANASPSNQVEMVIGVSEDPIDLSLAVTTLYVTSSNAPIVGFGLDSTTAFAGDQFLQTFFAVGSGGGNAAARYLGWPGIGKHVLSWNEATVNAATVTFYSNSTSIGGITAPANIQSGVIGRMKG